MMNISDIEQTKKFKATFKGITAVVNYRIDEDWFSVYYYSGEDFIEKDTHETTSEQRILHLIRIKINTIIANQI